MLRHFQALILKGKWKMEFLRSPVCQSFGFKTGENGEPRDLNDVFTSAVAASQRGEIKHFVYS